MKIIYNINGIETIKNGTAFLKFSFINFILPIKYLHFKIPYQILFFNLRYKIRFVIQKTSLKLLNNLRDAIIHPDIDDFIITVKPLLPIISAKLKNNITIYNRMPMLIYLLSPIYIQMFWVHMTD